MITDRENAVLDKVMAMYRRADEHRDTSRELEDQAKNERLLAEEVEEAAEELWKPMMGEHPEWRDRLVMGEDPREER